MDPITPGSQQHLPAGQQEPAPPGESRKDGGSALTWLQPNTRMMTYPVRQHCHNTAL
jgi:hypothetical protein